MRYNFDKVIERTNTNCKKWDGMEGQFGFSAEIPMWIADMDFPCPDEIVSAIVERAKHPVYGYVLETEAYEKAIKGWLRARHSFDATDFNFCFCPGVVPAISIAVQEFSKEGDYVLIQRPVYYPFSETIEKNDRRILNNPLVLKGDRFEVDFEDFRAKVEKFKPSIFIICNPHNPVGRSLTKDELKTLGDICVANGVIIVSDEIHSDIMLDNRKHTPMASVSHEIAENCISFYAPSKTFNIAGLKASAVLIKNKDIMKRFLKRREMNCHTGMNVFAQVSFEAAYTKCDDYATELIKYIEGNRDYLESYIKENIPRLKPLKTEATYLAFVDCRELGLNDHELEQFMLKKADIAFDMGAHFGIEGSGFIRVNLACPKAMLEKAMAKLKNAVMN